MKIYSVNDPEFKPYGRVVTGLEAAKAEILQALATTPLPEATDYVAEEPVLQKLPATVVFLYPCSKKSFTHTASIRRFAGRLAFVSAMRQLLLSLRPLCRRCVKHRCLRIAFGAA